MRSSAWCSLQVEWPRMHSYYDYQLVGMEFGCFAVSFLSIQGVSIAISLLHSSVSLMEHLTYLYRYRERLRCSPYSLVWLCRLPLEERGQLRCSLRRAEHELPVTRSSCFRCMGMDMMCPGHLRVWDGPLEYVSRLPLIRDGGLTERTCCTPRL
jgi:hypothetical protein